MSFAKIREILIIDSTTISLDGKIHGAFIESKEMEKLMKLLDEVETKGMMINGK